MSIWQSYYILYYVKKKVFCKKNTMLWILKMQQQRNSRDKYIRCAIHQKKKKNIYSVRRLKLWLRWKWRSVRASRVSGRDKHALHKQAKHRVQATRVWWKPPKVDQSLSEIDVRSVLLGTRATKSVLSLSSFFVLLQ